LCNTPQAYRQTSAARSLPQPLAVESSPTCHTKAVLAIAKQD
jgi:hypothetical protein